MLPILRLFNGFNVWLLLRRIRVNWEIEACQIDNSTHTTSRSITAEMPYQARGQLCAVVRCRKHRAMIEDEW